MFGGADPAEVSSGGSYHPERRGRHDAGVPAGARERTSSDGQTWTDGRVSGWGARRIGQSVSRSGQATKNAGLGLQRLAHGWDALSLKICGRKAGPCESTVAGALLGQTRVNEFQRARAEFLLWKSDARPSTLDMDELRGWERELLHFAQDVAPHEMLDVARGYGDDPGAVITRNVDRVVDWLNQNVKVSGYDAPRRGWGARRGQPSRTPAAEVSDSRGWGARRGQPSRTPAAEVSDRPSPDVSRSRRSSWGVRRIGQIMQTDAQQQAAINSLDRDWNALTDAVCGSARSVTCDTPTARALGASWVNEFRQALGDFRTWRDDERDSIIIWGTQFEDAVNNWRAELERFRGDVVRVTGTEPTATPRAPDETLGETIGHGLERAGGAATSAILRPVGLLAGIAILLVILSRGLVH